MNDERNGKAKEYYDNGNLIYEGEYLKGKKKGRAKVYNYDGLLRIGKINNELEYKIENNNDNHEIYVPHNDKIIEYERRYLNGKGKEYYSKFTCVYHQILKFEGEYLNGNRNGKGKEYDEKGNLIFEGEYINGKRNGMGKKYYTNYKNYEDDEMLSYEGEYLNRNINDKGNEYDENGNLIFEGEYVNGKRNGMGKEFDLNDNLTFEGEFVNGHRWNGNGKE